MKRLEESRSHADHLLVEVMTKMSPSSPDTPPSDTQFLYWDFLQFLELRHIIYQQNWEREMWKIRVHIIERERGGEIDWHVNEKKVYY